MTGKQYDKLRGGHKMHKHSSEWVQTWCFEIKTRAKNFERQDEMVHTLSKFKY